MQQEEKKTYPEVISIEEYLTRRKKMKENGCHEIEKKAETEKVPWVYIHPFM